MPTISVIMPVYNVEPYLTRSIESVLKQTYSDWELIIVDDGSTDNSNKVCQTYSEKDSRIKVYSQKNSGSGVARQSGMNKSSGKYICFIDPDDFIAENAFKNNIEKIERYDVDIVINGYHEHKKNSLGNIKTNDRSLAGEGLFNKDKFRDNYQVLENGGGLVALWNKLYDKKFLVENNIIFNNQRVGQDAVFNYNVYKHVQSLYFDNNAYYYYDQTRDGSAVKKYNNEKFNYELSIAKTYESMFEYWGKKDIYTNDILYRYWVVIQNELVNLIVSTSPLTIREASKKLKNNIKESSIDSKIQKLNISDIKGPFAKVHFKLITNQYYRLSLILMKLYNSFKLKY